MRLVKLSRSKYIALYNYEIKLYNSLTLPAEGFDCTAETQILSALIRISKATCGAPFLAAFLGKPFLVAVAGERWGNIPRGIYLARAAQYLGHATTQAGV